jgi:hypothetical protein
MQERRNVLRTAERAIVSSLLRDDHPDRWSRAEIETEVSNIKPLAVSDALARLHAEGVIAIEGEEVQASTCARHLDALEMLCI